MQLSEDTISDDDYEKATFMRTRYYVKHMRTYHDLYLTTKIIFSK